MHQDLVLIHKRGAKLPPMPKGWSLWATCLRQIAIGQNGQPLPKGKFDVFVGEEAYAFCLEVVCGLHSPLAGETEVMGQFREFLSTFQGPQKLKRFLESILTDAKSIRHKHLSQLGSQSYGSLCRRHLQNIKELHVLGAGKLTKELLPWFSAQEKVIVHCRQPGRHKTLLKDFGNVEIASMAESKAMKNAAVVIAAPLTSNEINAWTNSLNLEKIIDLRGESKTDPLKGMKTAVVSLKDFYESLESHQSQIQEKVEAARKSIHHLSSERTKTAELRPFGWDDLCA
jgi:glutamyl-tRNA reductase